MAIEVTGTPIEIQSSTNASSQSVTVPADADFVVVGVAAYESGVQVFTNGSLSLNGVALDKNIADASDDHFKGGQFYLENPATGSQTLAWDWSGTAAVTMGVIMVVRFYKGVDTADPIRDSYVVQMNDPMTTDTLTAQSGDFISAWSWQFGGVHDGVAWTNATEIDEYGGFNFATGTLAEVAPSGNVQLTADWTTASDGGIAALVLKAAAGSSSPTVNPTGLAMTISQGSLSLVLVGNPTVTPAGLAMGFTQGTIAVSIDGQDVTIPLSGQAITITQGTFDIRADVTWGPTGQALTFAQGDIGFGGDALAAITGQSITIAQGTVTAAISGVTLSIVGLRMRLVQGFPVFGGALDRGKRIGALRRGGRL